MQVWNYNDDGFRRMLRLFSMVGIFWWWCCLLLLTSASLDAKSTNNSSNDSSSSRMFGGFLFRRRTSQVPPDSNNNINVEEEEFPQDWTFDDAEDKTFHSDDVRLPFDPEAYMSSVRWFYTWIFIICLRFLFWFSLELDVWLASWRPSGCDLISHQGHRLSDEFSKREREWGIKVSHQEKVTKPPPVTTHCLNSIEMEGMCLRCWDGWGFLSPN